MHFGSPTDSWDPCGRGKPSYIQYIIRQGKAKLSIIELTSVFHHLPSVGPKQLFAFWNKSDDIQKAETLGGAKKAARKLSKSSFND